MRRREFLKAIGSAAAFSPVLANAQPTERVRAVGVLFGSPEHAEWHQRMEAFVQSLKLLGWTEGRNLRLDVRWTGGERQNNAAHARELVGRQPDVILAGPSNAVIALKSETSIIPIVFVTVSDPVAQGIVDNLARPTGNLTGFTHLEYPIVGKWLQILKEAAPGLRRASLMISTVNASSPIWYRIFNQVALSLAIEPTSSPIGHPEEIEAVIKSVAGEPHGAVIVPGDTMVNNPTVRKAIIELTAAHRLPALYGELAFAENGGLISYGIDSQEPFRRAATYVDRILRGEKPSDLPVQQPTKFHFVINLKTAKALGLDLSPALVATAHAVIE
jgi:putative ABC transport system substrate-binding protein